MTRPRNTPSTPSLFLGIDPGTAVTGWAVLEASGSRLRAVEYGCVRTAPGQTLSQRLHEISAAVEELLHRFKPSAVAIEQAFYGKNIQSMLRLGEARGAILATCARTGHAVYEYPTASVKKAITGQGRGDKTQVQFMLQRLLNLSAPPSPLDASDALALAVTLALESAHPLAAAMSSARRS